MVYMCIHIWDWALTCVCKESDIGAESHERLMSQCQWHEQCSWFTLRQSRILVNCLCETDFLISGSLCSHSACSNSLLCSFCFCFPLVPSPPTHSLLPFPLKPGAVLEYVKHIFTPPLWRWGLYTHLEEPALKIKPYNQSDVYIS